MRRWILVLAAACAPRGDEELVIEGPASLPGAGTWFDTETRDVDGVVLEEHDLFNVDAFPSELACAALNEEPWPAVGPDEAVAVWEDAVAAWNQGDRGRSCDLRADYYRRLDASPDGGDIGDLSLTFDPGDGAFPAAGPVSARRSTEDAELVAIDELDCERRPQARPPTSYELRFDHEGYEWAEGSVTADRRPDAAVLTFDRYRLEGEDGGEDIVLDGVAVLERCEVTRVGAPYQTPTGVE